MVGKRQDSSKKKEMRKEDNDRMIEDVEEKNMSDRRE